jgi:hypothetical protein
MDGKRKERENRGERKEVEIDSERRGDIRKEKKERQRGSP